MRNFSISEYIISVVELVEAQANDTMKLLEKTIGKIFTLSIVVFSIMLGILFLLFGIHALFENWIGNTASYFLTSLVAFFISFIIYGVYLWKTKQ